MRYFKKLLPSKIIPWLSGIAPVCEPRNESVQAISNKIARRFEKKNSSGSIAKDTWCSLIQRDPAEWIMPNFAQNSLDALDLVFMPWLRGEMDDFDYESMLRLQYELMIVGRDGQSIYQGLTETIPLERLLGQNRRDRMTELKNSRLIYNFNPSLRFKYGEYPLRFLPLPASGVATKMYRIPKRAYPVVKPGPSEGNTVGVYYPLNKDVPHYLRTMKRLMLEIRSGLSGAKCLSAKKSLVEKLACYFQLGEIAHLYVVGNTALYHTQAIGILNQLGLNPRLPYYIDHYGYVLDHSEFAEIFWGQASKNGVPARTSPGLRTARVVDKL